MGLGWKGYAIPERRAGGQAKERGDPSQADGLREHTREDQPYDHTDDRHDRQEEDQFDQEDDQVEASSECRFSKSELESTQRGDAHEQGRR